MKEGAIVMREYLFKGRTKDTHTWVVGYYAFLAIPTSVMLEPVIITSRQSRDEISSTPHIVDYDTVGQYTGYKDMHNKRIFVGDILLSRSDLEHYEKKTRYKVYVAKDGSFRCAQQRHEGSEWYKGSSPTVNSLVSDETKEYYTVEIIGNIQD